MTCEHCGESNPAHATFCAFCGAGAGPAESKPAELPSGSAGGTEDGWSARRAVGWLLVGGAVAALILAGVGLVDSLGGASAVVSRPSGVSQDGSTEPTLESVAALVPHVIGSNETQALSQLAANGIPEETVTIIRESAAVPAPMVTKQSPSSGAVYSGFIELTVAEPLLAMPDVIGLDQEIAATVLSNAGIDSSAVQIRERPYGTLPGLVLAQEPRPGSTGTDAAVILVAAAAPVPNAVGMSLDEALDSMAQIGAQTEIESLETLDSEANTVVRQSTSPGEILDEPIVLVVAIEPPSAILTSMRSTQSSRCSVGSVEVANTPYPSEVYCYPRDGRDASIEYEFGQRYERLRLVFALTSQSQSPGAVLEILGDGRLLGTFSARSTQSDQIEVDVTGVNAISLRSISSDAHVALLGARVYQPGASLP